jgi:hypothetical protein
MSTTPYSSQHKNEIRALDKNLVQSLYHQAGRRLSYLGLPSPWMGDVESWLECLDVICAIEEDQRLIPDMVDKAYTLGCMHKLHYYLGDIDQILVTGVDARRKGIVDFFPVDLINLDYCGGLVYSDFKHVAALESCIRLQAQSVQSMSSDRTFPFFLLLVTHNYRAGKANIGREYASSYIARELALYNDELQKRMRKTLKWLRSSKCPTPYRHKVFLIGKVKEIAEPLGLAVRVESVICYEGDRGSPMMHYQFQLVPQNIGHPVPADSGLLSIRILDFPILDINGEDIAPSRPRIQN